jgi:hypothetical protein
MTWLHTMIATKGAKEPIQGLHWARTLFNTFEMQLGIHLRLRAQEEASSPPRLLASSPPRLLASSPPCLLYPTFLK